MHKLKIAKKILKSIIKVIPKERIIKALYKYASEHLKIDLPISIGSDDNELTAFMEEYELDKPENMMRFLVEINFENFENLNESIKDLKEHDLLNIIGQVTGAKKTFDEAINITDPQRKMDKINLSQSTLNIACSQLKLKIVSYIDKQRAIDDMNRYQKILRGKKLITDIDSNNKLSKQAIRTLLAGVTLHTIIAQETGDNIETSVLLPFEEFKKRVLEEHMCELMLDYDADYSDGFWCTLEESMNSIGLAVEASNEAQAIPINQ